MREARGKSLGRYLTPEEGERHRKIAEAAEAEMSAVRARHKEQGYLGHLTREDVREVIRLGAFLKSERERQGLDLAEVARRSGVKADDLQAFEEGRSSEPPVSLLTRYSRAVGKSLMLGLRPVEPAAVPPGEVKERVEASA